MAEPSGKIIVNEAFARPHLKMRTGPAGVHFFNRATGRNVLFEEVHVDRTGWAAAPRQVSIALTNACDLRCDYCFAPKNAATLDFARVRGWLDELDANGCLGIGFGGGNRHFIGTCRSCAVMEREIPGWR